MAKEYDGEPRWDGIDPAVRAACEQWWAELEARAADPEVQARLEASRLAAQTAPPPWELPGWVSRPSVPGEPGLNDPPAPEEVARVKARLKNHQPISRTIKVTPDREKLASMTKLKAARKRVKELAAVVRDEAFEDWHSNCVVTAQHPGEWTRAAVLYASYLKYAARYGNNRGDRRLAKEELATETAWGKMMGSLFEKKRRRAGQYYPLRLKRDA